MVLGHARATSRALCRLLSTPRPCPPPAAQGLFHPARKVREVYWRLYNSTYIGAQVRGRARERTTAAHPLAAALARALRRLLPLRGGALRGAGRSRRSPRASSTPWPRRRPLPAPRCPPLARPRLPLQDALVACYPRMEDDGINSFRRHELDVFI